MKIRVETSVFDDNLLQSSIEQTAESILLEVRQGYYTKTEIDQTATSITALITDETNNRKTLIRAQSGGVITACVGQTYGVYTNAVDGSVDIVTLSWSGNTPTIASTIASYGTTITLGSTNSENVYISSSSMQIRNASQVLAEFGSSITLGSSGVTVTIGQTGTTGKYNIQITNSRMQFRNDATSIGEISAATISGHEYMRLAGVNGLTVMSPKAQMHLYKDGPLHIRLDVAGSSVSPWNSRASFFYVETWNTVTTDSSTLYVTPYGLVFDANKYDLDAAQFHITSVTADGTGVWFGIGSGGKNHGIYSKANNGWLIYANASGNMYAPIAGSDTASSGNTCYIGSTGRLQRSSSSKRYKHDIDDLQYKNISAEKLYDLRVAQFVFNDDHIGKDDPNYQTLIPGFIAEEVAEAYPVAAILNGNGQVEDWDARLILPPMMKLIQEQKRQIDSLSDKIDKLLSA